MFSNSSKIVPSQKPKLAQKSIVNKVASGTNQLRLKHCEPVISIAGTSGFNVVYDEKIQPGHFPWLGPIASSFETYKFNSLKFTYVPFCAADTNGSLALFWDPDSKDYAPSDLTTVIQNRYSALSNVWTECVLKVNENGALNPVNRHYTRMWSTEEPYDSKTYDTGKLIIATNGVDTLPSIGIVFVEYDISLFDPQVSVELGGTIEADTVGGGGYLTDYNLSSVEGRLPVDVRLPNDAEVADGATAGKLLLDLPRELGILMTRQLNAGAITGDCNLENIGSGVDFSEEESHTSTGLSINVAKMKAKMGSLAGTKWVQPYTNTSNFSSLTNLLISFALTNYLKYEL